VGAKLYRIFIAHAALMIFLIFDPHRQDLEQGSQRFKTSNSLTSHLMLISTIFTAVGTLLTALGVAVALVSLRRQGF
jgi:hypothetical protein